MSLKKHLVRFLKDDRGQTTTEYILILAVVVMIAMKFKSKIIEKLGTQLDNVAGDMDKVTKEIN